MMCHVVSKRGVVAAVVLSTLGLYVPSVAVDAAGIPASPMDFEVSIDRGQTGPQPDCDPSPEEIGARLMMGGGTVDMTCKIDEKQSDADGSGTVSNATLAESDEGFNDGTISQTCDMDQKLEMAMTIGAGVNKMTKFKGKMFQACVWKMEFADAASSTLSGTMEMNGTMGSGDGVVADGVVTMELTLKVYMVDGTGIFEGYTGGGEFTRSETMDMGMGGAPGGGDMPQDDTPTGLPSGDGSSGPTGPVQMPKEVLDVCAKNNLDPCDERNISRFCQTNMAACASIIKQSAVTKQGVRASATMSRAIRKFASDNAMTMELKKGAGAVRILSPAAPTGQPKAPAVVGSSTKIEIVATEGANCAIRTNRGKTIATKRVTSSELTVLRPRTGAFVGVSSIRAVCKIGSATVSSNVVKTKLRP